MNDRTPTDAAYTKLTPDSWHQTGEGYSIDCPECGSAASLMNVVTHGRCNGYLDDRDAETDLDEESFDCTAKLWFELGYVSDPEPAATESAAEQSQESVTTDEGVPAEGSPPGTDGTVSDDQQ